MSILIHDGLKIADSYTVQAEEDLRKISSTNEKPFRREVYFDTTDIIQLIQGALSIYTYRFDQQAFHAPSALVSALAFAKWLGPIHILAPHQDELINNLTKESHLFPSAYQFDSSSVATDILEQLGLGELAKPVEKEAKLDFRRYGKKLKDNARSLFKLNHLLNHYFWTSRYKYLFDDKDPLILIDNNSYDIKEVTQTKLFRALREAFDEARNTLKQNNIIDALAFCQLQEKLNAYKDNPKESPLPIFYLSRGGTAKAIKKVMARRKEWFTYEHNGLTIPIVRDADFFILDAVFSPDNQISDLDQFLRKIKDIKDTLQIEFDRYQVIKKVMGKDNYDEFSQKINEVVDVEFFSKFWLEENNYQNLNRILKEYVKQDIGINKGLVKYVKEEKQRILISIRESIRKNNNYDKFVFLSKVIEDLQKIESVIKDSDLSTNQDFDIFRDFALIRFSIDADSCRDKIETTVKNLINAVNHEERSKFDQIIVDIASSLIGSAFEKQDNNTLINLGVLWVFKQYSLINKVCDHFNENYLQYQSALLHGASIFPSQEKKVNKVLNICRCIEKKPEGKKYKARIGLSYIYYQIWYELSGYPILLEFYSEQRRKQILDSQNFRFIEKAIEHISHAHDWLADNREKEEGKMFSRSRKYYYSINNLLYFHTQATKAELFNGPNIEELADTLENVLFDPNYKQPRFSDTLAVYYLRKALIALNEEAFNKYINDSLEHNARAIDYSMDSSEKYKRLNRKIEEAKLKGFSHYHKSS